MDKRTETDRVIETIAAKLRQDRRSIADISRRSGLARKTLYALRDGATMPHTTTLKAVELALDADMAMSVKKDMDKPVQ